VLAVPCPLAAVGISAAARALLPPLHARRTATGLLLVGSALWAARLGGVLL
jgi:hypothetical protein